MTTAMLIFMTLMEATMTIAIMMTAMISRGSQKPEMQVQPLARAVGAHHH